MIGESNLVGSTQLINGLCSKICLWSVVRDGEAHPYSNKLTEERGSQDRPTGFPFPTLDTTHFSSLCAGDTSQGLQHSSCVRYFSVTVIKYPDQNDLREKRLVLA